MTLGDLGDRYHELPISYNEWYNIIYPLYVEEERVELKRPGLHLRGGNRCGIIVLKFRP